MPPRIHKIEDAIRRVKTRGDAVSVALLALHGTTPGTAEHDARFAALHALLPWGHERDYATQSLVETFLRLRRGRYDWRDARSAPATFRDDPRE